MLDAYTLRKTIPRLVVAAILISISWPLLSFAVQLSNDLGNGVLYLIETPFHSLKDIVHFGNVVFDLLSAGAILALGIIGLLSFLLTAAVAIFIAIITLIVRQILVIGLLIISPIAIVAYILPNTEKIFKLWRSSFIGVLIAFPIISMFIATGRVFSAIAANADGQNPVYQIIAFIAYFAPYFMLPLAFKMSGGVMGSVAGAINSRGAGARKMLSAYRSNKTKENLGKIKNFSRFSDKTALGRGANTALGALANPRSLKNGRGSLAAARLGGQTLQGMTNLKSDPNFEANKNDDNFLIAVANSKLAQEKLENAQQALAAEEAKQASLPIENRDPSKLSSLQAEVTARQRGINAAGQVASRNSTSTRIAALNALTQTGYQFSPGERGYEELTNTVDSIAGDNRGARSFLMDQSQFNLKNSGKLDLAGTNHGAKLDMKSGIRKLGNYGRGQTKPDTYYSGASAWLGKSTTGENGKTLDADQMSLGIQKSVATGETGNSDVAEWHSMLVRDYESATDANKLEIKKQMDAIENYANSPDIDSGFKEAIDNNKRYRYQQQNPDQLK